MILYDDKTENAIKTGNQLFINNINAFDDITFQASYIVLGNLHCTGKIFALFDLIVFGNVIATEIDIKGRFVCMGRCNISRTIVVQNDIWAEDIQKNSVICHDRIVAQSIDANTVIADGNIIIGKTFAIEEKAQTYQNVICGETAYGAGKIAALRILTVEPLDLDDGEEALASPFQYVPKLSCSDNTEFSKEWMRYAQYNDYFGFISKLMKVLDEPMKVRFKHYLRVLKKVENAYPASISKFNDAALLIWMLEISHSDYFKDWTKINEWTDFILLHFKEMAEGEATGLQQSKPVENLDKGYTVLHRKYGRGVVISILHTSSQGKMSCVAEIEFELHGKKFFPLPESLKFFSILSEDEIPYANEAKVSIQYNIGGYSEWLSALHSIYIYKDYLGTILYDTLYSLLLSKLGLKPKFVEDRFKEGGCN